MSSSLIWKPVIKQKENYLPDELKFILRDKFVGGLPYTFKSQDISYLQGLNDCGIKGALELIEAIINHGEVYVSEEY